jgi:hypothetical protein
LHTYSNTNTGATYKWLECQNASSPSGAITGATAQAYTPTISGYYACEINLGGCVVTSTCTYITVCPLSNAVTLTGNTITVNTIPQDPYFEWFNCADDETVIGTNSPSFTATTSGNYAVYIYSDWEECSVISECVTISIAGIKENEIHTFNVSPNPASTTVSINNLEIGSTIQIADMTGKIVSEKIVLASEMTLDINDLNNGIYFVQLATNTGIVGAKKLVVNK